MKNYPKSLWTKWSFVKTIPAGDVLCQFRPEFTDKTKSKVKDKLWLFGATKLENLSMSGG
jgi:hypothetical protein